MQLIVGLGNPGPKYEKTRHNAGFLAVDYTRAHSGLDFSNWRDDKHTKSLVSVALHNGKKIVLMKPQTYMNNSGNSVSAFMNMFDLAPNQVTVIHDEVDVEFGKFKQQTGRGPAGHNGIRSIIDHLKTRDFTRVRIGVWPMSLDKSHVDTADFVLKPFSKVELAELNSEIFPEALGDIIE